MTSSTVHRGTHDGEYPATWDWKTDGPFEGRHCRFERTPHGKSVQIATHADTDVERTIWLDSTALVSKVTDEVRARPSKNLDPGERIKYTRASAMRTSGNGNDYWPFVTWFENHVEPSALDILGAAGAVEDDDDDDEEEAPF